MLTSFQMEYNLKNPLAFAYGSSLEPKVLVSSEKTRAQKSMSIEESDNELSDELNMDKWKLKNV